MEIVVWWAESGLTRAASVATSVTRLGRALGKLAAVARRVGCVALALRVWCPVPDRGRGWPRGAGKRLLVARRAVSGAVA